MSDLALFELSCPRCGLSYPQLLPDDGSTGTLIPCPHDGEGLVKAQKLADPSGTSCSWTPPGGG